MEQKLLEELKESWLSAFPDCTHPFDTERFIRYAIELAKLNGALDHSEMERRGGSTNFCEMSLKCLMRDESRPHDVRGFLCIFP